MLTITLTNCCSPKWLTRCVQPHGGVRLTDRTIRITSLSCFVHLKSLNYYQAAECMNLKCIWNSRVTSVWTRPQQCRTHCSAGVNLSQITPINPTHNIFVLLLGGLQKSPGLNVFFSCANMLSRGRRRLYGTGGCGAGLERHRDGWETQEVGRNNKCLDRKGFRLSRGPAAAGVGGVAATADGGGTRVLHAGC